MKVKHHATTPQKIQINDLLKEHLIKLENGLCEYKDGWDDEKIAKAVSIDLNRDHAAHVRTDMYGKLNHRADIKMPELRDQIVTLQKSRDDLNARLTALENLHAKLCDTLALQKVANVKHLAGPSSIAVIKSVGAK